jgi:predicted metal-dependent peptidase
MPNYLSKAKASLILDHPFFASLLFSMDLIEDKTVKTLATNGEFIKYNPEYVAKLDISETIFVLAHETMHCVFQHMHRRGGRDAGRWNIAADYVINDLLIRDKVGAMPTGGLHNPDLVKQGNGTTEGVYNLIPESENGKGPGEPGGAMDEVQDAAQDQAGMAQKEAEMRVKIVQAANAAKSCGKLSAGVSRLVKEFTKTRTDWHSVLRRFLSERTKTDLSYARPRRRYLAEDIYLPSLLGEKMGSVVVAVDCSGSVDERLLKLFAAEIKAIHEDIQPSETHIVYFDSRVLKHDQYSSEDSVEIQPMGGGGTAFSPVFEYLSEHNIVPAACVFLTDLYCDDFGDIPDFPVLWATVGHEKAPFGEILKIQER